MERAFVRSRATRAARAIDQGLKERATAGAITSGIAAGGLNVNEGSAKDVRVSQTGIGEQDIEQVRQRAALLAYGYKVSATNAGAEAQLNQAAAGQDIEAGWLEVSARSWAAPPMWAISRH